MEAKKVLQSSMLDILFENRNRDYGAYDLRKGYNIRFLKALSATLLITGMVFGASYIAGIHSGGKKKLSYNAIDVQLTEIREERRVEPPPPPPRIATAPKMEVIKFTAPRIVKDVEVKSEETPPVQEKLEEAQIGVINQEGVKDDGVVSPPSQDAGRGVIGAPVKPTEDEDKVFMKVEIESEYPGGAGAWLRYLNKNFHYPEEALSNEIQGTVIIQFIVDKDGNLSNVFPVSGPDEGGLREEAIRVIKQSGKWIPAIQNGRKVTSFKKQPVVFMLATR